MTIVIHAFLVWALIAVIGLNIFELLKARDIRTYARTMRIWMPVGATMIAAVIFTGIIMMAAKHLAFTLQNNVMILFSIVLIVLEAKRYKLLKRCDITKDDALQGYRKTALRMLGAELLWSIAITAWMAV